MAAVTVVTAGRVRGDSVVDFKPKMLTFKGAPKLKVVVTALGLLLTAAEPAVPAPKVKGVEVVAMALGLLTAVEPAVPVRLVRLAPKLKRREDVVTALGLLTAAEVVGTLSGLVPKLNADKPKEGVVKEKVGALEMVGALVPAAIVEAGGAANKFGMPIPSNPLEVEGPKMFWPEPMGPKMLRALDGSVADTPAGALCILDKGFELAAAVVVAAGLLPNTSWGGVELVVTATVEVVVAVLLAGGLLTGGTPTPLGPGSAESAVLTLGTETDEVLDSRPANPPPPSPDPPEPPGGPMRLRLSCPNVFLKPPCKAPSPPPPPPPGPGFS